MNRRLTRKLPVPLDWMQWSSLEDPTEEDIASQIRDLLRPRLYALTQQYPRTNWDLLTVSFMTAPHGKLAYGVELHVINIDAQLNNDRWSEFISIDDWNSRRALAFDEAVARLVAKL